MSSPVVDLEGADRALLVREIKRRRVSAILRTEDPTVAREAMYAAVRGGFDLIEFTLSIPGALGLVAEFAQDPRLLVGVGTVLDRDQARAAVSAGARFLVSPVLDLGLIEEPMLSGFPASPGTYTPTEMLAAHRAGADFVKLFPAPDDIARYIIQVRGPLPFLQIFPTAGVNADNAEAILEAGAAGVGFVSSLFPSADLRDRNYDAIEQRARAIITRLRAAPNGRQ
ncbi:MAG: bifunctional 4-hydroxy-2-oxoglutarate aldolase/2-dehydro-3-deoxy-phosphogluconate aldolase [Candidatus Eisenbacteria bacterium]|nr:bifunctional 4-hydroxy-2-oxoglutarate aldolase/2-dehydro-3-deoxy-phosphogluconate aldolase [Candidatus Eisenbacteria bacterium]